MYCSVVVGADTIIKTTKNLFPFSEATARLELTQEYTADLAKEPLPVAPLTSTELVRVDNSGLFAIRLTMGLIKGASVESLRGDEKKNAIAKIIGHLCRMSTVRRWGEPGILHTPIDALLGNWHMDADIPTLVDIYPPLSRDCFGRIKVFLDQKAEDRTGQEQNRGRLGTMVPNLVMKGIDSAPNDMTEEESLDWAMNTFSQVSSPRLRSLLEQRTKDRIGQYFSFF